MGVDDPYARRVLDETPDPETKPSRRVGALVGLVLGSAAATVAAAVGIAVQSHAYVSSWTQERIASARHTGAVVGGVGVGLGLLVLVVWFVATRRLPEQERQWRVGLLAVPALLLAAVLAVSVIDPYTSYWLSIASALLLVGVVGALVKRSSWQPARSSMALTGLLVALVMGGTAVAVPYVRHQVPPRDLIDWWAAHDNPPIGFYPPISELRAALDATPQRVEDVVGACRSLRQAFEKFGGPPSAPLSIRSAVATVSADLVVVAERCESEAETITVERAEALIDAATSSDAARRIDAALYP